MEAHINMYIYIYFLKIAHINDRKKKKKNDEQTKKYCTIYRFTLQVLQYFFQL